MFTSSKVAPYDYYASSTDEYSVILTDVSVRYQLASEKVNSLKERAIRMVTGRSIKYNEFWALRRINLQVRQGEALGLIGRNGAGKSTLLKVVARVLKPTSGRVWVRGSISPLIELGAGFHPELTGRENLFLNGSLLGFSQKQMQKKLDGIVAFAGLESFIDVPTRTYSSGMIARLGFAIAADADPDILIIDEALSVGDETFQKKCIARMNEFRDQGVTIFFVTHGIDTISSLCPRSVWIEGGQICYSGPTEKVIQAYRDGMNPNIDLAETQKRQIVRVH